MPLIDVSTSLVIEEVKKRPTLWNSADPDYKNRKARLAAWKAVCRAAIPDFNNMSPAEKRDTDKAIQQRWKTARDAYTRNKALIQSGSGVKKYFYFDRLLFLEQNGLSPDEATQQASPSSLLPLPPPPLASVAPLSYDNHKDPLLFPSNVEVLKVEQLSDNEEESYSYNSEDPDIDQDGHTERRISIELNDHEEAPTLKPVQSRNTRKIFKRKFVRREPFTELKSNKEIFKLLKETSEQMKNDNMSFFMSMLPIVNKFSDQQKLMFRSKVLKIAMEVSSWKDDFDVS